MTSENTVAEEKKTECLPKSEASSDERTVYQTRFGKAAWVKAVRLSGSHRARAQSKHSLTEHFTAADWLNLCARFNMVCPWCLRDNPLTPHHRKPLGKGGANTIDNIWPLCKDCHDAVHHYNIGCEGFWQILRWTVYKRNSGILECHYKEKKIELENPARVCISPIRTLKEIGTWTGDGWETQFAMMRHIDFSRYRFYPSCLIENGDHLEWWAGSNRTI